MFNSTLFANSRPDGSPVLEVAAAGAEEPRLFVPLRRSELSGRVTGPLAELTLTQVYGYERAQLDRVIEALYRFPLPGDAAVTGVTVRFGDVEIRAELRERAQAEKEYGEAVQEGKQAALVTRESPDVFTLRVAGLQPDQEVTVRTSYVQVARAEGTGWSLRIPLTTSPRYVRSDERTSRTAQGQPLALWRDPGHRFSLDILVAGAAAVSSSTHKLATAPAEGGLSVRLAEGEVLPDRDCVLRWQPAAEAARPHLAIFTHEDPQAAQTYFLAMVTPPSAPAQPVAREAILLVDHSGSMSGPKWEAADWAVAQFLAQLTPQDAFDLCFFHNTTRWLAKAPLPGKPEEIQKANEFLAANRDSGGTELGVALEQALDVPRAARVPSRHLLIITDAEVSDEGRILRLAEDETKRKDRRRISVLCIDAAPNSFLARQLAERGGGTAVFLTSAPEEEDITSALDEVLADWAAPVLAGLRLETGAREALAAGRLVSGGAIDLGDLPAGRSVWVAGRVPSGTGPLRLAALAADGTRLEAGQALAGGPGIKALFGAWRVAGLEFLIASGRQGKDLQAALEALGYGTGDLKAGPGRVYAENARQDAEAGLKGLLVSEALSYGLACSETAFVAVRQEQGKKIEETVITPNALPAGWDDAFVSGPAPTLSASAMPGKLALKRRRTGAQPLAFDASGAGLPVPNFLRASHAQAAQPVAPMPMPEAAPREPELKPLYAGAPDLTGGEAVLFDTARAEDEARLSRTITLTRLSLGFPQGSPAAVDAGLVLYLYVDDMAAPRARVRLADLLRQGGQRPLNIARNQGARVLLVLRDENGAWKAGAPEIEIKVG